MSTAASGEGWLLAIDTGGPGGSLGLARGGELVEVKALAAGDGFGHVLFGELDQLLKRHGVRAADMECFAAAVGPGSFTGIRVALSAVKGFAETTGRPAIGVSSLQALAWYGTGAVRAPYYEAGRGEIYGGLFDASGLALAAEYVGPEASWRAALPLGAERIAAGPPLAGAVAMIAWRRYLAGERPDPMLLEANYVRRSDAELNWRDG